MKVRDVCVGLREKIGDMCCLSAVSERPEWMRYTCVR